MGICVLTCQKLAVADYFDFSASLTRAAESRFDFSNSLPEKINAKWILSKAALPA